MAAIIDGKAVSASVKEQVAQETAVLTEMSLPAALRALRRMASAAMELATSPARCPPMPSATRARESPSGTR